MSPASRNSLHAQGMGGLRGIPFSPCSFPLALLPPSNVSHGSALHSGSVWVPKPCELCLVLPPHAEGLGRNPTEYYGVRGKEKDGRGICAPTFLTCFFLLLQPAGIGNENVFPVSPISWLLVVLHVPSRAQQP